MYEEFYTKLTPLQAQGYLKRIGFNGIAETTVETLDGLIFNHQCSVPFENLDIFDFHKEISLNASDLYEKIVVKRRGGYCFELNLLFYSLLIALGYEAIPVAVRLKMGRDITPPYLHRATLVKIDGLWRYADVGLGAAHPRKSVALYEGYSDTTGINSFDVIKNNDYWVLRKTDEESPLEWIMIREDEALAVDFLTINYYCSHSEDVRFTSVRLLNLNTPDGYLSLTDNLFTEQINGVKKEKTLLTKEELNDVILKRFAIDAPLK